MRPKPRSARPGATRRVMLYAPRTLTAKMRSHSWPLTSRNRVGEVMPALLTRAPTGGTEPSRAVSALSTEASSVTSQPMPTAWTPCRSAISWAASLALASSRSRMEMFQPAAARGWGGVGGCAAEAWLEAGSGDDGGLVGYGHGFLREGVGVRSRVGMQGLRRRAA